MLVRSGFLRFRLAVLVASFAFAAASRASDCDGDGAPDEEEVAAGAPDCNENGIPDACDIVGTPFGVAEAARIPFAGVVFQLDEADLDGDGAMDLAACTDGGVVVFLQRAAGEFEIRRFPEVPCNGLRASDLDGDGDADLAIGMDTLIVMKNSGGGVFTDREGYGGSIGHLQMEPLDMDGDGDVDLASFGRDGVGMSILFNAGDGTYPSQTRLGSTVFPSRFTPADIDADGDPDLAALSQFSTDIFLFRNTDGRGAFGPESRIAFDSAASGLVVAELDGGGLPELLVYASFPGRLCVVRAEGGGVTRDCRPASGDHAMVMHLGDLGSDGGTDLLIIESAVTCGTPWVALHADVDAGPPRRPPTAELGFVSGPAVVGDVIGDATPEIVIVGQGFQTEVGIRILRIGPGPALPDCNRNGIPDECDLAGSDWNFNLQLDSCEVEAGLPDCDQNGIPDAQDPDCDGNGIPDPCDIAAGSRPDLDADGVPDDCEPRPGSLVDCNRNGISDEVDVGTGNSGDCNANAIPDECDTRRYVADLRTRLPVPGIPTGVALPDLDGNGIADAAVLRVPDFTGSHLARKTSLLLYRRGASWSPVRDFAAGIMPANILVGDLDGNGIDDLLTLNRESRCLSPSFAAAFLNRGEGNLETPRVFAQGSRPTVLAAGDLDGDGDLDAAIAGEEDGHAVRLFLNDGSGAFARGARLDLAGPASDLIASDLDGDSDLDLAIGSSSSASVALFRNEAGTTFTAGAVLPASFPPVRLVAADLEGSGTMDIVSIAGPVSVNAFFVFENDAAGGFEDERTVPLGVAARVVAAFDADADGIDDLAFAGPMFFPGSSPSGDDLLHVRTRGGREFDAPVLLERTIFASAMATGDTDADGDLDLAVADPASLQIRFYRNAGEQGFDTDFRHTVGSGSSALIASDLDRDGYEDVIVASSSSRDITVLRGSSGSIAHGKSFPVELVPRAVAAADLDGDGDGDLVAVGDFEVRTLFREAVGSYLLGPPAVLISTPMHVAASDLDGDGDMDMATANVLEGSGFNDTVSFLANDGGRLAPPRNFAIGMHPGSLCAADLDSDGDTDLVTSNVTDGSLSFLWNGGAGDFGRADTRPWTQLRGLLAADLDGDGLRELIGAGLESVSILENGGGGTFVDQSIPVRGDVWPLEVTWYGFAGGDLEDDGDIDLVLADATKLLILENRGGLFPRSPEVQPWWPGEGSGASGSPTFDPSLLIALPDIDGNGRRDLAFAFPFADEVLIVHDRGPGSRDLDRNRIPDECNSDGVPFRRGETNGDGFLDLSDAISVLRWLFAEGAAIPCLEAADGNDDGRVDLSDPVWLLRHLFLGAPPPYDPFLSCGGDPTPDTLGCASFPECEG